jgi:hypothetical protein
MNMTDKQTKIMNQKVFYKSNKFVMPCSDVWLALSKGFADVIQFRDDCNKKN